MPFYKCLVDLSGGEGAPVLSNQTVGNSFDTDPPWLVLRGIEKSAVLLPNNNLDVTDTLAIIQVKFIYMGNTMTEFVSCNSIFEAWTAILGPYPSANSGVFSFFSFGVMKR